MLLKKHSIIPAISALLLIAALLGVHVFAANGEDTGDGHTVLTITFEDLAGKRAAVMTGTPQADMINANVENAQLYYFNNNTDCLMALREKKVDCYINNTFQYPYIHEEYPEFTYIDEPVQCMDVGTIFPKKESGLALLNEYNAYLSKITADGTLEELRAYWLNPRDWELPEIPSEGERGTIRMCTCASMKPFSFMYKGGYAGFDIALVAGFCVENGYALEIYNADFAGMLSGIATGKYDIAGAQIAWTEERAEKAYYSDFTVTQKLVLYVRTADFAQDAEESGTDSPVWDSVVTSFRRTFIDENRWQMIVKGVGVTLLISIFGFALANIFGAIFCAMTLSGNKLLATIADVYSRIMQGTPIVVILMILFYIVFGNADISGIMVSILGFGISTGAYLAQLFAGGISAVDAGQKEAALTLGLTPVRAFTGIVLPQAVRTMLPAYFSQFISLMKNTSIVGYIAVMDLTKAVDVIRSSTFEAFFPLLSSAAIYLLISCLLLSLLKVIQRKLAPRRRTGERKEEKA